MRNSVDFKLHNSSKKQVAKIRIDDTESTEDVNGHEGMQPLADSLSVDVPVEIEIDNTNSTPIENKSQVKSQWPLSALIVHGKWDRLRSAASSFHLGSMSPLSSLRRHRHNSAHRSSLAKHELNVVVDDPAGNDATDVSRSPLQKFKLCKTSYYTKNAADWVSDSELIERREFIVVLAASLQKFGAATHLTEAFTDAVAQARTMILCHVWFNCND
jgi:hypothetical protein